MNSARQITPRPTLKALLLPLFVAVTERDERTNGRTNGDGITQNTPVYIDPPTGVGDQRANFGENDGMESPPQ